MSKRRRRKRTSPVLWILLGIVCVLILVAAYFAATMISEYNSKGALKGETVTIEIKQGEGTWDIAAKLKEEGLIRYKSVFYLKARNMGATSKLRYGTFTIYKEAGLESIINSLVSGGAMKEETRFTVPEGYTIEQIAVKLEEEGICLESEFLQAVEQEYDYWFLESIPADAEVRYRLQGFLYPETYAIADDMTAEDIVVTMLEQFGNIYTKDMEAKAIALGKTTYEVVIEASIIERETGVDAEKNTIAGVIKNRLEDGMKLQIDPTFLYPITEGLYDITDVTYEHTLYDSPYNTYQNAGLPPGPIANPALSSLEAALNPEDHDYFYYHTDTDKNDGSHLFTKTYQEHLNTQ
ncbi:MAG: endolytic transglycosylase MltG [Tyzzerella sp.]|nr:endolytic transglycosylase MltG [Tyzzerella sp.]